MVDYKYPPLKKGKKPKSGCRKLLELAAVVFLFGAVFVVIVTVRSETPPFNRGRPRPLRRRGRNYGQRRKRSPTAICFAMQTITRANWSTTEVKLSKCWRSKGIFSFASM